MDHLNRFAHYLGSPSESPDPVPLSRVILFNFIGILFALPQADRANNFWIAIVIISVHTTLIQQIVIVAQSV